MTEKKRSTPAESTKGKAPSKKTVPPQTCATTSMTCSRETEASIKMTLKRAVVDLLVAEAVKLGVSSKTIQNIIETNGGRKHIQDVPENRLDDLKVALKAYIAQVRVSKYLSKCETPVLTPDQAKQKVELAELLKEAKATMDYKVARIMVRKFGIAAVKELTPDQYKDFYDHCKKELALFRGEPTELPVVNQTAAEGYAAMMEAESRKLAMQTEAAINLGIGFVLKALGQDAIAIHPDALKKFTSEYKVEQEVAAGGSFTIKVVQRN